MMIGHMRGRRVWLVGGMTAAALGLLSPAALAKPHPGPTSTANTGYDVSWPQCPGTGLPRPISFAVVGVNDGIAYSPNPCLAGEYSWALASSTSTTHPHVSFYANTADPGSSSVHWPVGQVTPMPCVAGAVPTGCDYDYGWNAAQNSYQDAVAASSAVAAQSSPWWLDIESANSWNDGASGDSADIQGALAFLTSTLVSGARVGIYTNSSSWSSITGSSTKFAAYPAWLPGAVTLNGARSNCSARAPSGGQVVLSQYSANGLDADYPCV